MTVLNANINRPAYMDCGWILATVPISCDRVQKHAKHFSSCGTQRAIPSGKDGPSSPVRGASQSPAEFSSNSK